MEEFKFDIKKSVEENISSFLILSKLLDEEMATLLVNNIRIMIPLPESSPKRTAIRASFNKIIMEELEKLEDDEGIK